MEYYAISLFLCIFRCSSSFKGKCNKKKNNRRLSHSYNHQTQVNTLNFRCLQIYQFSFHITQTHHEKLPNQTPLTTGEYCLANSHSKLLHIDSFKKQLCAMTQFSNLFSTHQLHVLHSFTNSDGNVVIIRFTLFNFIQ